MHLLFIWLFGFFMLNSYAKGDALTAQIVDYGVYSYSKEASIDAGDKVAGGLVLTQDKGLLRQTTDIDGKLGVNFGFRYRLLGSGDGAEVTIVVTHPKPLKDPQTGKEFARSQWSQWVPSNHTNWNTGWVFEHDWEIVPGDWLIELFVEDAKLLEKKFVVRSADQ